MNNPEQFLKNIANNLSAPRTGFDAAMRSVTQTRVDRTTISKARMLSPYQSFVFSMKKIAAIGIPVIALALIVVSKVHKSPEQPPVERAYTVTKDSSIDEIMASFVADADTEASIANSESQDDAAIESQLQDYTDLKSYEI